MNRIAALAVLVLIVVSCQPGGANPCEGKPTRSDIATSNDPAVLHLWVSNQSPDIDPVAIEVAIDGTLVVCDWFDVEDQHNWIEYVIRLDERDVMLQAQATGGEANLTQEFSMPPELWGVLEFWFYEDDRPQTLTLRFSDQPVGFD